MINWQRRIPSPPPVLFKTLAPNPRDRQSEMFRGEALLTLDDTDKFRTRRDGYRSCTLCVFEVTRGVDYARQGLSLNCVECAAISNLPPLVAKFPKWVRVFVSYITVGGQDSDIYVARYEDLIVCGIEMVNEY